MEVSETRMFRIKKLGLGLGLAMVGVDGAGGGTPTISIHTASE